MKDPARHPILRAAALLAPRELRADWLSEWSAELWVVQQSGKHPARFCLGAFRDALWLRRNSPQPDTSPILTESPLRCLLLLAFLAAVTVGLAFQLPGSRNAVTRSPLPHPERLVLIANRGVSRITLENYRRLASSLPAELEDVAFYRPEGSGRAVASANLPMLLGAPELADAEAWRFPGHVNGWIPATGQQLAATPGNAKGYAIGRLKWNAPRHGGMRWQLTVPKSGGDRLTPDCSRLEVAEPMAAFVVTLVFAIMVLPATIRFMQDEGAPGARAGIRRWVFFAAKVLLLVTIVFFGIMDLGSGHTVEVRPQALVVCFVVAFRWAMNDQRRRCPICLRRLTNPVRFGGPSQMFLDWYGTELVCAKGHGMMHVPEIPSSSYASRRWLSLDA
jgi:hypothetical protein